MAEESRIRNTTLWQVTRGMGAWVFGAGAILLVLLMIQRDGDDWTAVLVVAVALFVAGGAAMIASQWMVRRLDAANLPLLHSPQGHLVLRGRDGFDERVIVMRRWLLGALLLLVLAWILVVTVQACGVDDHTGMCSWERPGDVWNIVLLLAGVTVGAGVGALSLMHEVHHRESERMGQIVAEGRKQRRIEDPFAGVTRNGWDFD